MFDGIIRNHRSLLRRLFAATAFSGVVAIAAHGQTLNDSRLRLQTWTSGLTSPTTFAWIGPSELFVIEKDTGKVKWIKDGTVLGTILDLVVQHDSERGGLGITVDPDFATNHYVYIYWSSTSAASDSTNSSQWVDNRLERYEWNGTSLVNKFGPLLAFPKDSAQANGPNHDGGVIRFGPDGKLYGQVGDLNRGRFGGGAERVEQNTAVSGSASVGGIFRINSDGSIPTDNPFIGEADASFHLWFMYGFRNSFGFTWDPLTDKMWSTENGPNVYDEINRVSAGMNSGWLKIMGPDSRDATYSENGNKAYNASDLTYLQNAFYRDPELSFLTPIGITAIGFIPPRLFPGDLRNNVYFGDTNNGSLYYVAMDSSRLSFVLTGGLADKVADTNNERRQLVAGTGFGVITDIHTGADGYVYLTDLGLGNIFRIRPVTDFVAPSSLHIDHGTKVGGKLVDLDRSDNAYFSIADQFPGADEGGVECTGTCVLNGTSPKQIDVNLECNVTAGDCFQVLQILDLDPSLPPHWQTLDTRLASQTDQKVTIAALPNPSNYVDPATRTTQLRLIVREAHGGAKGGATQSPPFVVNIDQLRLSVTYP